MSKSKLFGRIIKGKKENDFKTLSNDERRKIIMLIDMQGLETISSLSGRDKLLFLGWDKRFLKQNIDAGYLFKMVVFPEVEGIKIATWDNVLEMIKEFYPGIVFPLSIVDELKETSFKEIESLAGYNFLDVKEKNDPRFMDLNKLQNSCKSVIDYRSFLYHSVHLKEQFSGDGWTHDAHGKRIVREYVFPNTQIKKLKDATMLDVEI